MRTSLHSPPQDPFSCASSPGLYPLHHARPCRCPRLTPTLFSSSPLPTPFRRSEAITKDSVVQFARSRSLPLLARYIQEQRFRYVEAGIPVGQAFIYEDPEAYAEYTNKTRDTMLKIARALRGKVWGACVLLRGSA